MYRVETVTGSSSGGGVAAAAQLLHDFTVEYDAGVTVLRIALASIHRSGWSGERVVK
jgi:hypothetical protein